MCWGIFSNLVDQGVNLGAKTISIFGYGEPLVDKGVAEKIEYCASNGLDTFITTNAAALTQAMAYDVIEAGLKDIRFSFHAVSAPNYQKVHRRLNWLKVVRNIGNFMAINDSKGHPCTVHFTVIPFNGETVEEIRDTWEGHCDYLEIWRPHNWGGARSYRKPNRAKRTCGRPFNGPVQIQADGTIIPCCFLTNSELVLGSVHDDTIADILNGNKYEDLRRKHWDGDLSGLPCEFCDQLNEEPESPLLYSNRDPEKRVGRTSTCKVNVL